MDDQALLVRFATTRDSGAFEELAQRYAGLVKSASLRVLGNSHDAEEVAQECFLELARHAAEIHSSVAGWLHRAATSRSLNRLRSRRRRTVREREVGMGVGDVAPIDDVATQELLRVIETAVVELPDDLRLPMMRHYFDGQSQREVAVELGVNQSTISRRMRDALRQLREKLIQAGYVTTAPIFAILAPDRPVLAGTGSSSMRAATANGKAAGSATLVSSGKAAAMAAVPLLSFLFWGGWISLIVAVGLTMVVARSRPLWVKDLYSSLGRPDLYHRPTYCLKRWDWQSPPAGWRVEVLFSLVWAVFYGGLSYAFALGADPVPVGIVVLGTVVAIAFGFHALRLLSRVHLHGGLMIGGSRTAKAAATSVPDRSLAVEVEDRLVGLSTNDPTLSWMDAVQLIGIGLAGVGLTLQTMVFPPARPVWPAVMLAGTVGTGMLLSGVWMCRRLVSCSRIDRRTTDESHSGEARSPGTRAVLAIGVAIVVALSVWITWNPSAVRGLSLSLAAVQTSMLGWMVYRLAAYCRAIELSFIRRVALVLLVSCFVLNSSVCLANWLR